jgi:hypothetical protein
VAAGAGANNSKPISGAMGRLQFEANPVGAFDRALDKTNPRGCQCRREQFEANFAARWAGCNSNRL